MHRTKTLTTKNVRLYKTVLILIIVTGLLAMLFSIVFTEMYAMSGTLLFFFYLGYKILTGFKRIKHVAYDNSNLYVAHNDYEIQIPFEDIKEVYLESGGYEFKLYKKTQIGDKILCLPSIWYPLNFKKVDAEIDRIRGLIYKKKMEYRNQLGQGNNVQLSSVNLEME